MKSATELQWGLKLPNIEAPALWGARCILEEWRDVHGRVQTNLDVVWDRQSAIGAEADNLCVALKDRGILQKFRKWAVGHGFLQTDDVTSVVIDGVRFHASTRRSFGYLYVTAHLEAANG